MNSSLSRLLLVPILALLFLAAPAEARPIDCSAEGQVGASRCLIATERVQSGRDPLSSSAQLSLAGAIADGGPAFTPAGTAPTDDLPWPALLLATVCIVAFMAHRRGGG